MGVRLGKVSRRMASSAEDECCAPTVHVVVGYTTSCSERCVHTDSIRGGMMMKIRRCLTFIIIPHVTGPLDNTSGRTWTVNKRRLCALCRFKSTDCYWLLMTMMKVSKGMARLSSSIMHQNCLFFASGICECGGPLPKPTDDGGRDGIGGGWASMCMASTAWWMLPDKRRRSAKKTTHRKEKTFSMAYLPK